MHICVEYIRVDMSVQITDDMSSVFSHDKKVVNSVPFIKYELFEDFVFHCINLQRLANSIVKSVIDHSIWSDGLNVIATWKC